jgi:uncharacterized membrane protein
MSALRALGLGAISGLRSASGPAFVSRAAARGDMDLGGTRFAFLGSPLLAKALTVMQLGETIGDKLPFVPSRTNIMPLIGRAVSGGLVGAAAYVAEDRQALVGVLLGSSAAVTTAFAGEGLRGILVGGTKLPDPVVAGAEDALVLLVGSRATRSVR